MKKTLTCICILLMGVASFFTMGIVSCIKVEAFEQDNNKIYVNGEGVLKVSPDIASLHIGLKTEGKDVKVIQQENAQKMTKIINSLKEIGIDGKNIKTIHYYIYPVERYDKKIQSNKITGYVAVNTVEITVKEIDMVGKVIDIASNKGANQIQRIRFGVSDENKYYLEALKLAVTNANKKAQGIAEIIGVQDIKPISIKETSFGVPIIEQNMEYLMKSQIEGRESTTPIEIGQLEVKACINVEYCYK